MDGHRWAEHEHGGVGFVENKEPITSEVSAHQRAPPGTAPRPSTIVPLQQGAKMVDLAGMVKVVGDRDVDDGARVGRCRAPVGEARALQFGIVGQGRAPRRANGGGRSSSQASSSS